MIRCHRLFFYLVCFILIQQPLNLYPQVTHFNIEILSEATGLSHNCISCIYQDNRGFIWIGTEGVLNKYDGYKITEYLHDPDNPYSISHNFIRTIFEDPADSGKALWIGTKGGGLNKYDRENDQFISYRHIPDDTTSLSHNEVKCIFKDSKGRIWLGTEGGGLNKFDKESGKFTRLKYVFVQADSGGSYGNYVLAICEDHQGFLWLANGSSGLDMFDPESGKFYHYPFDSKNPGELPYNTFTVHEDRNHILWIGTRNGLRIFDRESDCILPYSFKEPYATMLNNATIWDIYTV